MNIRQVRPWVILLLLVVIVCGIGSLLVARQHHSVQAKLNPPQRLVIARTNPLYQPGIGDFTVTISDATTAQRLSQELKALKPVPASVIQTVNCPKDDGLSYQLTFSDPATNAQLAASGCQWVTQNGKSYYSTAAFRQDVQAATKQPFDPPAKPEQ